jgi:hypothetical protein
MPKVTRETPSRSERASLTVVSNASTDTITGPIPLPRTNKVAASGEEDCDSLIVRFFKISVDLRKLVGFNVAGLHRRKTLL